MPDFEFVDTPPAFETLCRELDRAEEVVLDLEADSFHRYHPRICLIQLSVPGKSWILDPLAEAFDAGRFTETLRNHTLILHGCDYDLRMMKESWNFRPTRIFDTEVGARLIGHRKFGLGNLVKHYFGVTLDKSNQRADWGKRPLSPDLLDYAAGDTCYLLEMTAQIRGELRRLGRLSWAEESCDHLLASADAPPKRPKEDPWRISGHSHLTEQQLGALRAVWGWREAEAERRNLPPFKVFPNERLLDLATRFAGNRSVGPDDFRKMPRHLRNNELEALAATLREEAVRTPDEWPRHHKSHRIPHPAPDPRLVEKLKSIRDRKAEELDIDETLIATKPQLLSLALAPLSSEEEIRSGTPLMEWQYSLFLPEIIGLTPR